MVTIVIQVVTMPIHAITIPIYLVTMPIQVVTMPILAVTMRRSRWSRCADPGGHDGASRADAPPQPIRAAMLTRVSVMAAR
ncbi:MAG: hypothetical protein IPH72_07925 [Sandaracinaceae bacterium]|nr:hypothetical protein [Sandaracinaceae bacterium]